MCNTSEVDSVSDDDLQTHSSEHECVLGIQMNPGRPCFPYSIQMSRIRWQASA